MQKINWSDLRPYITKRNMIFISILLLPLLYTFTLLITDDSELYAELGRTNYQSTSLQKHCKPDSKPGDTGTIYGESTSGGIKYNIRTPLNYDPTIAHRLLMVYAPAKANRIRSEVLTGLTKQATSKGFIVAYADHPNLSTTSTIELGTIPSLVAKKWCIDEQQVYLTGHSDGGTVSMALAFMTGTKHIPSAIAPSAAGVNYKDLQDRLCPKPLPVLIMHSKNDHLFPGYGEETSGWWAACNKCGPIPDKLDNGCLAYTDCAKDVKTWYCEGDKLHSQWPELNSTIIDFFTSSVQR